MDQNAAGKTFPPYAFPVERGKIREFADAIGDPNPIYRDPDHAAKTPLGGIVGMTEIVDCVRPGWRRERQRQAVRASPWSRDR